jgi:hypothetical protein
MWLLAIAVTFASTRVRDHEVATAYRLIHEPTPQADGTSTYDKRASKARDLEQERDAPFAVKKSAAPAAWICHLLRDVRLIVSARE